MPEEGNERDADGEALVVAVANSVRDADGEPVVQDDAVGESEARTVPVGRGVSVVSGVPFADGESAALCVGVRDSESDALAEADREGVADHTSGYATPVMSSSRQNDAALGHARMPE